MIALMAFGDVSLRQALVIAILLGPVLAWLTSTRGLWSVWRSDRRAARIRRALFDAKLLRALLLAVCLASAAAVTVRADDDGEVVMSSWCGPDTPCGYCMASGLPWSVCVWLLVRQ